MKRKDLLRHLERAGCEFLREGRRHTVYYNPKNLKTSTIPRHREINNFLARKSGKFFHQLITNFLRIYE